MAMLDDIKAAEAKAAELKENAAAEEGNAGQTDGAPGAEEAPAEEPDFF